MSTGWWIAVIAIEAVSWSVFVWGVDRLAYDDYYAAIDEWGKRHEREGAK